MYLHFFQLRSIFTITVKNYPRTVHTVLNRNFIYKIYKDVKHFLKNYYRCTKCQKVS